MLRCQVQVFEVAAHPFSSFLAVAQIDGAVLLHSSASALEADVDREPLAVLRPHKGSSCRSVAFSAEGDVLFTVT